MKMVEFVRYTGKYPSLCWGELHLRVDGIDFIGGFQLKSGGKVSFSKDWEEMIQKGPWTILEFPESFPEEAKEEATKIVNENVPWGCCGGCV
jgi:hypothetical protein